LVSEKYLLSQVPTVESSEAPAREGSSKRCRAVVWAPMRAARSMDVKPFDAGEVVSALHGGASDWLSPGCGGDKTNQRA